MSLIFIDCETTGLDPTKHEIWELAYAIDDGPVLASNVGHTLENADPKALEINNYHERMKSYGTDWYEQDQFEGRFRRACEGKTLVGANPAFDAKFLAARWGSEPWHYRMIDVQSYSMGALGLDKPPSLKVLSETLGVDSPDHSAMQDVITTRQCFRRLNQIYADMRRKSFV